MLILSLLVAGGLLSYPERTLGPELQKNGGFEEQLQGWTARHYAIDVATCRSGKYSVRLDDADRIPHAQSIFQALPGSSRAGFYRVTAWMKTRSLGANGKGKGVRIGLRSQEGPGEKYCSRGCGYSRVYSGTQDWFRVEVESIYLEDPSLGVLVVSNAYRNPSGTYWLDDVVVRKEEPPSLDVVLRVPNYRGILWSDQPQTALFDVRQNRETKRAGGNATEPSSALRGLASTGQGITAIVSSDKGSSRSFPAQAGRVSLDLSTVQGQSLVVTFHVDGQPAYPPFHLVRRPASDRDKMTVTFSPDGRFLVRGTPTFLLGVYDSGLGFTNGESRWEASFAKARRLFELPGLNGYINYWYGNAPERSMEAMMNVLQEHGVLYWQTANCFGRRRHGSKRAFRSTGEDRSYATRLGEHPGLGGWYLADECVPALADEVHADHLLLQRRDPDGVNLGVFNSRTLNPWLPSLDVIGLDQYPMYGAEPAQGYPLGRVFEGASAVRFFVGDDRPFWHVIQFFQFTKKGRWPTRDELRSMSYAAIVGGADGLFYWSLGARALAWVCKPSSAWCPERVEYFERLRSVFAELSSLRALANEDLPSSLVTVSDRALKVRIKRGPEGAANYYAIVYNHSAESRVARIEFTPALDCGSSDGADSVAVKVHGEHRSLDLDAERSAPRESFAPWGVHVYEVQ